MAPGETEAGAKGTRTMGDEGGGGRQRRCWQPGHAGHCGQGRILILVPVFVCLIYSFERGSQRENRETAIYSYLLFPNDRMVGSLELGW